jgi:short subunit dehydrogenase-like uncharacterized protein
MKTTSERKTIIIYGSYGYTGSIIAQMAAGSGQPVVLSGRNPARLEQQAGELNLPFRAVSLGDAGAMDALLSDALLVIHCAGPFLHTWKPMAEACLRNGCHYLDITGEIDVFESLKKLDERFRQAGVMALPGAGFDVVPSDCLAMMLKERLPDAVTLELAFAGLGGGISRGTSLSAAERAGTGGAIRRNGRLVPVATAALTREVDFGRGPKPVVSIPWGDLSTAYTSTGIPEITVYMAVPMKIIRLMRFSRILNPLLRTRAVRNLLKKWIGSRPEGPTPGQRESGRSIFRARAANAEGREVFAGLITPEGYRLTALTAWHIAGKVAQGELKIGYQTPSSAYGSGLILEIPGCRLQEVQCF